MSAPFDAFAVPVHDAPHVTMQAGIVHLGRHWTTTTRDSAKAHAVRRHGCAAIARIDDDGRCVVGAGPAVVLDPLRPWTSLAAPVSAFLAGGAVLRLGAQRADQLLGYAEANRRVPARYLPAGRVIIATQLVDELVTEGDDVVSAKGRWTTRSEARPGTLRRPADTSPLTAPSPAVRSLPPAAAALAAHAGDGWLGVMSGSTAVPLRARWIPRDGAVEVGWPTLHAVAAALPGPVCLTLDKSDERRPDRKVGVMLRGRAAMLETHGTTARLGLRIERITHWEGFDTSTTETGLARPA